MSSPIADLCSLLLGGLGHDIRVFIRTGAHDIDIFSVDMVHGSRVPFNLKDRAWLTLIGKED